ncbi:protein FAM53A isoform X2 [Phacochoerus africanus]|uniref:protein FAM53A isoform X2 n=1 Tax=Phacochoerus africanus TaxID=41426 RepID=UPI001FDA4A30|nr:protein FAM53A isoform X2 [Phacochoerus africanus]
MHSSLLAECSAEKLNKWGPRLPLEPEGEQRPRKVVSGGRLIGSQAAAGAALPFPRSPRGPSASLGALSAWDLRESVGPPSAPPTKRHCRSLSEPEELARCRSPWRPGGSKVWTPVPKRRCHSGGSATLLGGPGAGPAGSAGSPPKPRPGSASARSGLPDPGPARLLAGPCTLCPRRRLSLSQEHLAEGATGPPSPASTPASTPELGRRPGLLRCRSQPCVRAGGPGRRKRRLEEDARWPRPALDFLKMTRARHPGWSSSQTPRGGSRTATICGPEAGRGPRGPPRGSSPDDAQWDSPAEKPARPGRKCEHTHTHTLVGVSACSVKLRISGKQSLSFKVPASGAELVVVFLRPRPHWERAGARGWKPWRRAQQLSVSDPLENLPPFLVLIPKVGVGPGRASRPLGRPAAPLSLAGRQLTASGNGAPK